jgi:hypothetical protein
VPGARVPVIARKGALTGLHVPVAGAAPDAAAQPALVPRGTHARPVPQESSGPHVLEAAQTWIAASRQRDSPGVHQKALPRSAPPVPPVPFGPTAGRVFVGATPAPPVPDALPLRAVRPPRHPNAVAMQARPSLEIPTAAFRTNDPLLIAFEEGMRAAHAPNKRAPENRAAPSEARRLTSRDGAACVSGVTERDRQP